MCNIHFPEIEMATREAPAENRKKLMESLIGGAVCEKMPPSKLISQDNLKSSCMSLFGESCLKCSKQLIKCLHAVLLLLLLLIMLCI